MLFWNKSVRKGYRLSMHPKTCAYDRTKSRVWWTANTCSHSLEFRLVERLALFAQHSEWKHKVDSWFWSVATDVQLLIATFKWRSHNISRLTHILLSKPLNITSPTRELSCANGAGIACSTTHFYKRRKTRKENTRKISLRDNSIQHRFRATLFHYDSSNYRLDATHLRYTCSRGTRYARESVSRLFI